MAVAMKGSEWKLNSDRPFIERSTFAKQQLSNAKASISSLFVLSSPHGWG